MQGKIPFLPYPFAVFPIQARSPLTVGQYNNRNITNNTEWSAGGQSKVVHAKSLNWFSAARCQLSAVAWTFVFLAIQPVKGTCLHPRMWHKVGLGFRSVSFRSGQVLMALPCRCHWQWPSHTRTLTDTYGHTEKCTMRHLVHLSSVLEQFQGHQSLPTHIHTGTVGSQI